MLRNYLKKISTLIKSNRLMKLNEFIAMKETKIIICFLNTILIFMLLNYIINLLLNLNSLFHDFSNPYQYIGPKNLFPDIEAIFSDNSPLLIIYIIVFIVIILENALLLYKISTYIGSQTFNVGQKGTERWATISEIKLQYKEVPLCKESFTGKGGVPVCHYQNKIYVDDSPTNNLILGITRGGKGEMFVIPMIDINSRAENKPSLVITDLKLELYPIAYEILTKRGYDVELLNTKDPINSSMGFDPLSLIVEAWKEERYSDAELLCASYAFSLYTNDEMNGDQQFWALNSSNALSAMILALIEDCLEADLELNNQRKIQWQRKQRLFLELPDEDKLEAEEKYFEALESSDIEDLVDSIHYIPLAAEFTPIKVNEYKINMYSVVNTFSELAQYEYPDGRTKLDLYFMARPPMNRAKLKYSSIKVAGDRTKGSICSNVLSTLLLFSDEAIAKMTAKSTFDLHEVGYGKKPKAIFIGLSDYDKSKHFIASVFIRQLYFVLCERASRSKNQKCTREVLFLLDEFGNLPAIENMANITTMCLSRNIRFTLFIQSFSQLEKYGPDGDTIIGNCANQIFITTNDIKTAEEFSNKLGNKTITNVSRMGEKLSLKKNLTESYEERPLLNANELTELQEGECVVKRVIKRRDLNNNKIRPFPIFNNIEDGTEFKYRYQYLLDDFPDDKIYLDIPMQTRDCIDLQSIVWNAEKGFSKLISINRDVGKIALKDLKTFDMIIDLIVNVIGNNFLVDNDITGQTQIEDFKKIIDNSLEVDEELKDQFKFLIESGCT